MRPLMLAGPIVRNRSPASRAGFSAAGCCAIDAVVVQTQARNIAKKTRPLDMTPDVTRALGKLLGIPDLTGRICRSRLGRLLRLSLNYSGIGLLPCCRRSS